MTEKYEPFRDAIVGDKVMAPQFSGDEVCTITEFDSVDNTIQVRGKSDTHWFRRSGQYICASKNSQRALWYVNDKGEMVDERPKKKVEKVIASARTAPLGYKAEAVISFAMGVVVNAPIGTPYKIIVEVEE